MSPNLKSLLYGAAIAALVILPTVPGFSQTTVASAAQPAQAGDWVRIPVRSYNASRVKLEDIVGTLTVAVGNEGAPMTVEVSGPKGRVDHVLVSQDGAELVIEGDVNADDNGSVWDWRNWFNFHADDYQSGKLFVKVTVPRNADVRISDLVGDATVGDTMGPLRFDAATSDARIGRIASAKIDLAGTGRIDIAGVAGELDITLGGSGKITTGSAGSVKADFAGSSTADFGTIAGGLSVDIAGSGNVTAAHVNGPTRVDIAGSGSVRIADGVANPLHVDMMGAGDFEFGGTAVDPHIDALGAGTVHIKAYRGHLSNDGMAELKIGE